MMMKLSFGILIVCAAQVILARSNGLCSEAPGFEDLEKKAIRYRLENFKQGYVRIYVIDDEPSPHNTECLFEITFDEHRVRQIRRSRQRGSTLWGKPEKIIVSQDKYITDHENADKDLAVHIAPATDYKSAREHFGVLNIQALGMSPNGAAMLHTAHVESLMNRSDRTPPEVHADVRDGISTWRIDYMLKDPQQKGGANVSLWIAPSQGYSVVGIYYHVDQDGKKYSTIINTQMKQYPEKDVWYPYKLIKTQKEDDRIIDRQVVTVEEARFGGLIDEAAFTPAGLELKPGREAVDSTSGQPWAKVWNGKEMVKASGVKTAPVNPDRTRWLLWVLAVGLALLVVFYFRRVIRRRGSIPRAGA
jgi:hypothetical protein